MSLLGNNSNNHDEEQPQRQAPERQDNTHMQPWFVDDSKPNKNISKKAKFFTKQTVSILFPILGLTVIILALGTVLLFALGLYE